ncbi:hypothetical protein D3H55_10405 [Bacillus salacetis]|uniref:Amino acid transporter n=1 Tax=Bacillus salacetis TaxID=2315464 RepID=A0A3A1QYY7_9BACI|nr:hypothetical protein [Bacillus salacetis]RIW33999.1 hypothetical protein D3H55_10405 [Bacillus salacetis]
MRKDYENWSPLSVAETACLFTSIPVSWGIAGGWALDLHIGKQIRDHADIDIVTAQQDLPALYSHLSQDWLLYKAAGGKLEIWREGDSLEAINNIWASRNPEAPFRFQILVVEFEGGEWLYKRNKEIKSRNIMLNNKQGIPYLRPEIQLLYKGGSSQLRQKDSWDFQTVFPFLTAAEKDWLAAALIKQFPDGHPWVDFI